MTIEEINRSFINYRTRQNRPVAAKYAKGSIVPIMPFLVADLIHNIYTRNVASMNCKFAMAQAKKQWRDSYQKFNKEFFDAFADEQVDKVVDFMDDFEDKIYNTIEILRIEILSMMPKNISFEKQMTVSYLILAYVLSWGAIGCWSQCYKTDVKVFKVGKAMQYTCKEERNPDLLKMAQAINKFTNAYCPELRHLEVQSMDKFYSLWDVFSKQIADFGFHYKGNF